MSVAPKSTIHTIEFTKRVFFHASVLLLLFVSTFLILCWLNSIQVFVNWQHFFPRLSVKTISNLDNILTLSLSAPFLLAIVYSGMIHYTYKNSTALVQHKYPHLLASIATLSILWINTSQWMIYWWIFGVFLLVIAGFSLITRHWEKVQHIRTV